MDVCTQEETPCDKGFASNEACSPFPRPPQGVIKGPPVLLSVTSRSNRRIAIRMLHVVRTNVCLSVLIILGRRMLPVVGGGISGTLISLYAHCLFESKNVMIKKYGSCPRSICSYLYIVLVDSNFKSLLEHIT